MKTSELLAKLKSLNVKVWADGTELGISAPKGALDAELVAALRARKSELLDMLGSRERTRVATKGAGDAGETIGRAPAGQPLPLSFSQRRLWFLDQLEPNTTVYNMPLAWTLRGALDVEALRAAVARVVERHDVLRARFVQNDGAPEVRIEPARELVLDVRAAADEAAVRDELSRRAADPFDLAAGALFRPSLFRLANGDHVLSVLVHHIVFDGWSADVFLREVAACYEAFAAGAEPALDELAIQYADFAHWQKGYLASDELARQLEHHTKALAGRVPVLDLPTDRPRPAIQRYRGANLVHALPGALVKSLRALAASEGASLYMILLAAYDALVSRWSGQTDFAVGTIVANRGRKELEPLIGFFANTLVLRVDLSGEPTFRELLARVKASALGAFENQDVPFEKLVEELQPERDLAYTPLFQTIFMIEDEAGKGARFGDVEVRLFELDTTVARTDLMLTVHQKDGGLEAWFEYSTDLFDEGTIARMATSYEALLEGAVCAPASPIAALPLVSETDLAAQLEACTGPAATDEPAPIFRRFEEVARRTPDAVAVVFPAAEADEVLTYAELDARANRLAHALIADGVAPRSLVGLCIERSLDMVVAMLAIQKAGAAYVPLDPTYPRDRIVYMATDAKLAHCVTTSDLAPLLPEGVRLVALDEADLDAHSAASPGVEVAPSDRMYVIYTSGSTGRPKGVELEHRSVSNFLSSMAVAPGFTADDRLLAVTTMCFDISVLEIALPLVTGGMLIVAPTEATADADALVGLFERLAPTVMQATPATWRLLVMSGWEGSDTLRAFCGGEALPRELAEELCPRAKELWNLYGPTETTIWSALKRIEDADDPPAPITIGRPIHATRLYVLDANRRPVPVGVRGELYIAGDGLARGYLDRPELTAERFVPDVHVDGERMYRTGDVARLLRSGEVECLGRIDNQIKLRGYRIELGEIEAVLSDASGVAQCVCVIREDVPGDQRLTAYFVRPNPSGDVTIDDLRAAAREKLPAYMVPAAFVEVDALPHTPNGKVDRNALLDVEVVSVGASAEYVGPRNETERRIADVWSEVLRLDRVAVDANFFDLGGHSLLLAEVHGRLRASLDPELTIIELFQYPTIDALAGRIDARGADSKGTPERSRDLAAGRQALIQRRRIRR